MNRDNIDDGFRAAAIEVLNSDGVDEAAQRLRHLASRAATHANQVNANHRAIDRAYQEWLQEHAEDLLDEPELLKLVKAQEQYLMRAFPTMPDVQRWHRAANDVRKSYGTADQRVIRAMAKQRGVRFRTEDDDDDQASVAGGGTGIDDEITANTHEDIAEMAAARKPREVQFDKASYNEKQVRHLQRGGK